MTDEFIAGNADGLVRTPVFSRTRVPERIPMEDLQPGDLLDDFLDDYISVTREHCVALPEWAAAKLVGDART